MSQLYRYSNSTFICSNHLYINCNRVGGEKSNNRYKPTLEMQNKWLHIAKEDSKLITKYINKSNVEK